MDSRTSQISKIQVQLETSLKSKQTNKQTNRNTKCGEMQEDNRVTPGLNTHVYLKAYTQKKGKLNVLFALLVQSCGFSTLRHQMPLEGTLHHYTRPLSLSVLSQ